MNIKSFTLVILLCISTKTFSQNPNFHIYLCFGQSNMEGQGNIEKQDKVVDSRFKVLQSLDCPNLNRTKNIWYDAIPPLCQCYSSLSPADYFGRTMVANLPDSISVGVINVAVGGCDIRLFDKDKYKDYTTTYTQSWFTDKINYYNGNPYEHLLNLAKLAQKDGVIKGFLLHQGETNTGNAEWPSFVAAIYHNLITDLSLNPKQVPILAGEVVHEDQQGTCASMNAIIAELPSAIPNAHVISSSGCADKPDNVHFNAEGYRKLGRRYAYKMLSLMGYENSYVETECSTIGSNCITKADPESSNGGYVTSAAEIKGYSAPPTDDINSIQFKVNVSKSDTYYLFGRFNNPSPANDSYWIKIDNENFELIDLTTNGWQWKTIKKYKLKSGKHTITIVFNEPGASIDKIALKNSSITPVGTGEEAVKSCVIK